MTFEIAIWTLLHVLVFVYWLGGDLGAFYTSRFLTAPNISPEKRLMAAKIVNDVDMAPRTALILALPTGYMLAVSSGWLAAPIWTAWLGIIAGVAWLAIAWHLHLSHGNAPKLLVRIDLVIRWALCSALIFSGLAGLAGMLGMPQFIAIKLILLAAAILMGLLIRVVLKPLGTALGNLSGPSSDKAERDVAAVLTKAKPLVMAIWFFIILAAFTGLLKPTFF
ncbi:hypothetical protein HY29_03720 [Hyphomonas beringensis]|uniref:Copper resistance protein D domain-containing protein n=1 Tax=Hyphomonas beringensis TaxID=1280946 RepID=A0A062U9R3_9PROT|nr:hypothetical protein [Hyphomonas beringensis]KCZ53339.1 hypothetical protein HY29_03720 [Hyphomonas beringensis]